MTARSIVDEVISMIPPRGTRPWWDRVNDGQAKMLAEIMDAWTAGKFGTRRRTAAKAIAATLRQHGVEIGEQGVDTWLRRQAK